MKVLGPSPRIALVTPYTGGNLGDAAIQDAMIANLRQRMPGAQFFGITLSCDNFLKQHGVGAFPLRAAASMAVILSDPGGGWRNSRRDRNASPAKRTIRPESVWTNPIRRALPDRTRFGAGLEESVGVGSDGPSGDSSFLRRLSASSYAGPLDNFRWRSTG